MKTKGFTLIELVVIMGIIAILMAFTVPSVKNRMETNRQKERVNHEYEINKALRQYYALEGKYPKATSNPEEILTEEKKGEKIVDILSNSKFGPNLDISKYTYKYKEDTNEIEVTLNEKNE